MLFGGLLLSAFNENLFAQRQTKAIRRPSAARANRVNGAMYANPVMAGDYPDPSVIRVGADYYATATSSEYAPEFPLLHSRDLVNWRVVGAVFKQRPAWSVGNYWAPEIAEDKGRFYVYYTARRQAEAGEKQGPLCVAVAVAAKPLGPYTDKGALICQDAGSIDAFPIRDENGRRYLVWKYDGNSQNKPTPIYAQPLTEDGTRLTGEMKELIRNSVAWEAQLVEGPFILRRNEYFYMFYSGNACCGRECKYAMGIARSKTLLGEWEKYDGNPILNSNEAWKCPGHGSIVSTSDGRDYLMYHAYHPQDTVYVGRQALLDEVTWTADGWASINQNRGASARARSPLRVPETNAEYRFTDEFDRSQLQPGWQWLQDNEPVIQVANGKLLLKPNAEQQSSANPLAAAVGYWTMLGDYTATTIVDLSDLPKGAAVGLAAFGDMENAIGIVARRDQQFEVYKREKGIQSVEMRKEFAAVSVNARRVWLRITATEGDQFQFAVSFNGRRFIDVGVKMNGKFLPPWDRGVRVMLTTGSTNDSDANSSVTGNIGTAKSNAGNNASSNASNNMSNNVATGVFESFRIELLRTPEAEARAREVRMAATKQVRSRP